MTDIRPFVTTLDVNGNGIVTITHALSGIKWTVLQIGFGLGILAPSPQIAAHVNGIPLTATVAMQPSVFSSLVGSAPYAMESFMVGPPYIDLLSGDQIVCGLIGGTAGDHFTAGAYIVEMDAMANYAGP